MIHREIIGNELFVWMNGSLLYKRWIDKGYGMVFCNTWGHRTFTAKDVQNLKF